MSSEIATDSGPRLMKKTVYIVATLHRYQGCTRPDRLAKKAQLDQFKDFLKEQIRHLGVSLLAEEMSEDALEQFPHPALPPKQSVPFQVARELNKDQAYCDADAATQKEMGISENNTTEDNRKRESYWLKRLEELNKFPCLFVVGEDHAASFPALLNESGLQAVLVAREWRPT